MLVGILLILLTVVMVMMVMMPVMVVMVMIVMMPVNMLFHVSCIVAGGSLIAGPVLQIQPIVTQHAIHPLTHMIPVIRNSVYSQHATSAPMLHARTSTSDHIQLLVSRHLRSLNRSSVTGSWWWPHIKGLQGGEQAARVTRWHHAC